MAKSALANALDALQSMLRPRLKALGFRVRGRTFNRKTADGLTQVVQFQMGAFDPPGTYPIPGMRENLYGKFTVNVGVYVPEISPYYNGAEAGSFVQEAYCCIRARIGQLGPDQADVWWDLRSIGETASELWQRLQRDALPSSRGSSPATRF